MKINDLSKVLTLGLLTALGPVACQSSNKPTHIEGSGQDLLEIDPRVKEGFRKGNQELHQDPNGELKIGPKKTIEPKHTEPVKPEKEEEPNKPQAPHQFHWSQLA